MTDSAGGSTVSDPFAALGLPAWAGLSDDDVRAAWRRIAAATHPDREDGGEPARFGAAAAAYAMLRTAYGRGEALADLGAGGGGAAPRPRWWPEGWLKLPGWLKLGSRARRVRNARREFVTGAKAHPRHGEAGRHGGGTRILGTGPGGTVGRTGARVASAGAVASAAFLAAGWAPSSIGVLAGVLTWLLVTSGRATGRRR